MSTLSRVAYVFSHHDKTAIQPPSEQHRLFHKWAAGCVCGRQRWWRRRAAAAAAAAEGETNMERSGGTQNGIFAGVFVSGHKFYVCNFRTKHKLCIFAYQHLCLGK
jgi:hypothetical protein